MTRTIRDTLETSASARATAALSLGAAGSVAIWENRDDRVCYGGHSGHVFSLYLQGGTGTRRTDGRFGHGRPGAVCILPEGQGSDWEITTPFRFVHLYQSDARLRADFARIHDCDARRLDLPELTFAERLEIATPLARLAQAAQWADLLGAEAARADLIGALGNRPVTLKGGLAPHLLRRIDDWIAAHLDAPIRLGDLADVTGLSEFHLHRMFRTARGVTLQAWVLAARIAQAKRCLATDTPLIEIALGCGFSSQSHFTRAFRSETGLTPQVWREVTRGPQRAARPSSGVRRAGSVPTVPG
ncbi:AraC family transcriptional regulator [Rhodobacter viridis]|uniref:AraC family transcriptional regulator n=1 Tax=Rhodobacter viridis TaxID=1054202 RepID=A0A318U2M9_9RHOB|nr:AraC family transcriptional regulator [Rhodobacter viridis]PYF12728.1 AraC family transcriptional regulator [Rhodobacter viridis]